MIYLDNAATTLRKPESVILAVANAMGNMGNSGRGGHADSLTASRMIYEAREELADLFGCPQADHVIFTCNATEALNIAIQGLFGPGDHVISTDWEHNSVLRPLYLMEEQGLELSFVPSDAKGRHRENMWEQLIRPNTKGIVCTHASNLTGNLLDLKKAGRFAKKHGLLFLVDASQTAGVFPIDMKEMQIDVVCFTGHKSLLGPQGTGGLCVGEGVKIRPLKVGGTGILSYEKRQPEVYPTALEAGTLNGHGIAGLLAGVRYVKEYGIQHAREEEQHRMREFYEGVIQVPGVTVYGDYSSWNRAPVVALNVWDYDSALVSDELEVRFGIATRPGAHCAPRMHRALGTEKQGAVRFSFSHFNTRKQAEAAAAAIREIAGE